MQRKMMLFAAVASLAMIPSARAQELSAAATANEAPVVAVRVAAPVPNGKITCRGVANVPMTADAAQALPMQIVANVNCGADVTILSDMDSYTVSVRTAEGYTGYVAAMYVRKAAAPKAVRQMDSAAIQNGVVRWQPAAKGCTEFITNGTVVESLTANGITVQVSLHDTGWKFRANVAIANGGTQHVDITPAMFSLDSTSRSLAYQDPEKLAKNMTHQVLWTEASAGTGNHKGHTPASTPAAANAMNASYKTTGDASATAPNYLIQQQYAEMEAVHDQSTQTMVNTSAQVAKLALKPAAIQPNSKAAGSVWFEHEKNAQNLVLRVPVGEQTFEFPLSFSK
ncbi:MAG TPA: SH3 domain-containing protein [Candidatus Acidoferrum sp.]|jgi:hypothetical protein